MSKKNVGGDAHIAPRADEGIRPYKYSVIYYCVGTGVLDGPQQKGYAYEIKTR